MGYIWLAGCGSRGDDRGRSISAKKTKGDLGGGCCGRDREPEVTVRLSGRGEGLGWKSCQDGACIRWGRREKAHWRDCRCAVRVGKDGKRACAVCGGAVPHRALPYGYHAGGRSSTYIALGVTGGLSGHPGSVCLSCVTCSFSILFVFVCVFSSRAVVAWGRRHGGAGGRPTGAAPALLMPTRAYSVARTAA